MRTSARLVVRRRRRYPEECIAFRWEGRDYEGRPCLNMASFDIVLDILALTDGNLGYLSAYPDAIRPLTRAARQLLAVVKAAS